MANLECDFAGIKMRNPIGLASHTPFAPAMHNAQRYVDYIMRYVENGAGFVTTGAIYPEREHPPDKPATGRFLKVTTEGYAKREGMFVIADMKAILGRMDYGLKVCELLKKELPKDVPVMMNIMGNEDPSSWPMLAREFEKAGADLIEMDVSCPLPSGAAKEERVEREIGKEFPQDVINEMEKMGLYSFLADVPSVLGPIVEETVKAVNIPVGVKMSPESGFPRIVGIIKVCARRGAKFVTSLNAPVSIAPPDIERDGMASYPGFNFNPFGAALGPWDRFLTYRNTALGSVFVPEVEYSAVGGIVHPRHTIELLMLGAKHVQLSSALLWEGAKVFGRFSSYLERFLDEKGYNSINDIVGLGKKFIQPYTRETDWGVGKWVAELNREKCNQCGRCYQGECVAINVHEDGFPSVNAEDCSACALCVAMCPQEAFKLIQNP